MDKVVMVREILMGMEFLNIPSDKFLELKKRHGSVEKLYEYISNKFIM